MIMKSIPSVLLLLLLILLSSVEAFQRIAHSHSHSSQKTKNHGCSVSIGRRSFPPFAKQNSSPSSYHQQHQNQPGLQITPTSLHTSNVAYGISDLVKSKGEIFRESFADAASDVMETCKETVQQAWWMAPMTLALVPLYSLILTGTSAQMPSWWSCVPLSQIPQASATIFGFLASNIAYFISGMTLIHRFPCKRFLIPTKFTMLGVWIGLAGLVSTIFHSVQALGSHPVAESLCYIDHGVALSAGMYYFDTLGMPSKKVWMLGIIGLLLLAIPDQLLYSMTHSLWHLFSAAAATVWGLEGPASARRKLLTSSSSSSLSTKLINIMSRLFPSTQQGDHSMHKSDALGILYQSV